MRRRRAGTRRRCPRTLRWLKDVAVAAIAVPVLAWFTLPWVWMAVSSITPEQDLFSETFRFLPRSATFGNYAGLVTAGFPRFFVNSVVVSTAAVVGSMVLAVLAAYGLSRFHFRGREGLLGFVALTQMFPWIILVTPVYVLFWHLHLVNTYAGLILVYIAITTPFCVFMLVGYLTSIPVELDDAAAIDGCSTWQAIWRVVVPVAAPGIVGTATYAFAQAWSEYVFALTLMTRTDLKTVQVGLASFFGEYTTEWGRVMAASSVATIPTVVFFLLLQRHLVSGLTAGAVKE
jgi:ABC-type glycerol-3-phosphate transport system permease component